MKKIPPGSKTATVQLLKKILQAPETATACADSPSSSSPNEKMAAYVSSGGVMSLHGAQLCCSICYWEEKMFTLFFCGVKTSFALSLRGWISDTSMFSNSSMSATRVPPFHSSLRSVHIRRIFQIKLSCQVGGASTVLQEKSDNVQ